jgi:hypothetical protein
VVKHLLDGGLDRQVLLQPQLRVDGLRDEDRQDPERGAGVGRHLAASSVTVRPYFRSVSMAR